ncbi:unnamed protein product [Closterium sp. NIES-54]
MVTTTTPGGQRVFICTYTRTGRRLATFTRRPGSSLYTLTTEPPPVSASAQVSASGPVAPPCSCRLLSHQTLLWHHCLGHPSLPCLHGMHSRLLVSGLPRSLPPLPPSPALPCLPCVEGRQRAAPHSSSFPPTTAPLQTLHMDVWGPAHVSGQDSKRYFLLVVDDYTRYTTVFPLHGKGEVPEVLIPWIRAVRLQLHEQFRQDLPVMRLHSDRGGEFSSDLLRDFFLGEGILQSFTLPASLQQNGIVERRIGLVIEVAHTSVIHAAAPHFLWPFVVRYATHQLKLWPRVSLPETSPTLRWTGKVGDASVFRVWGSRAFVRNTSTDKLSSRTILCDVTFDESVPFHRLFPFRSAPLLPPALFFAPGPPPVDPLPPQGPAPSGVSKVYPLPGAVPVEVAVDSGVAGGAASGGAESGGAELGGAEPEGAEPGGAESEGAESGGAELAVAEPAGAESEGAESGGAEPRGTASFGGPAGASPRLSPGPEPLSPQHLLELFSQCTRLRSGDAGAGGSAAGGTGAGGAGATSLGDAGVPAGARGTRGAGAASPGGARNWGARAGDPGAGGTRTGDAGAGGASAGDPCAGGAGAVNPRAGGACAGDAVSGGTGAGGTVQRRPFFVSPPPSSPLPPNSVLRHVLSLPSSTGLPPSLLSPPPRQSQPLLQPDSPLPAPSPYAEQTESFTERCEPESRPAWPVHSARTGRRVPRLLPRPSPPGSSLLDVPDPESDFARAASPAVPRLLATVVSDPLFVSTDASALVAELVDFAAACRLNYATSLVAESNYDCPPSIGGECALGTDVLEDRQEDFECLAAAVPRFASLLLALEGDPDGPDIPTPRSYAEAITGPYSSQWQTAMDAKMASWKSTGTYVDAVPPSGANIIDGMWIFRMKWPPRSPPVFKNRYVARGFSLRQGVDFFHTFSSTPKMTTLRVLLHVVAQRDYELHSLDFTTAFLQGSLHEEIWLRRPPGFTGSFPTGTQWSLRQPVYSLRQAPREWHDPLRTTLAALGFAPSTADPSLFLRTDTSLPPFYVSVYVDDLVFATADTEALALVLQRFDFRYSSPQPTPLPTGHSLSAPPSDESIEPSGPYP